MTTRDIQTHLNEIYGADVSPELISRVTDAVHDDVRAWRTRPLERTYPIVYLDVLRVNSRQSGKNENKGEGGADKKLDKIRNTKEDNYLVLR